MAQIAGNPIRHCESEENGLDTKKELLFCSIAVLFGMIQIVEFLYVKAE